MHSLSPAYLDGLRFGPGQVARLAKLGEARGREVLFQHQRPETLEMLRRGALIESSESSSRLEGIIAPRERIEALVLRPSAPVGRSEQEIAGYRDGLALIHESFGHDANPSQARDRMPFTVNVLLQLHGLLYRHEGTPAAQFKSKNNDIVERTPSGTVVRVRFRPTSAAETPDAMRALVARYDKAVDRSDMTPLVVVPLAILDLLCVHPFKDGNGRVARLATLMLLYANGFEVGRYISLERVIEQSKEGYYETLERSSEGWHDGKHDPHPWLDYFWGVLLRAYAEFEQRVESLSSVSKSDLVRSAVEAQTATFALSDIERACPTVSRELVRRVLRAMRAEGAVDLTSRGRTARWVRITR
jgi:Fic family protein